MTFDPDRTQDFEKLFDKSKQKIRNQPGCTHLELLKDIHQENIYFTYSFWEEEKYLNQYRNSKLFEKVWSATKLLFTAKPEAWSVQQQWRSNS